MFQLVKWFIIFWVFVLFFMGIQLSHLRNEVWPYENGTEILGQEPLEKPTLVHVSHKEEPFISGWPKDCDIEIDPQVISLVKKYEGFYPKPYWDVNGIAIGYGFRKAELGYSITSSSRITEEKADEILREWLKRCRQEAVQTIKGVELTDFQYDVLASFVQNIGEVQWRRSSVLRHFNQGNTDKAIQSWKNYVHGGGKKLPGLVKRRSAEIALFQN